MSSSEKKQKLSRSEQIDAAKIELEQSEFLKKQEAALKRKQEAEKAKEEEGDDWEIDDTDTFGAFVRRCAQIIEYDFRNGGCGQIEANMRFTAVVSEALHGSICKETRDKYIDKEEGKHINTFTFLQ